MLTTAYPRTYTFNPVNLLPDLVFKVCGLRLVPEYLTARFVRGDQGPEAAHGSARGDVGERNT